MKKVNVSKGSKEVAISFMVTDPKTGKKVDLYKVTKVTDLKRLTNLIIDKELTGLNELVNHVNNKVLFSDLILFWFSKLGIEKLTVSYLVNGCKKNDKNCFLMPIELIKNSMPVLDKNNKPVFVEKLHYTKRVKTGSVKVFEKQIRTIKSKDRIVNVEIEKPVFEDQITLKEKFSFRFVFEVFAYQLSILQAKTNTGAIRTKQAKTNTNVVDTDQANLNDLEEDKAKIDSDIQTLKDRIKNASKNASKGIRKANRK